ncbi:MAG TPA: hypothetical protein P5327_13705 [Kiritimatiellia bacterium]|nr:hypothetical protein [Kiritimatiellia bacterium]
MQLLGLLPLIALGGLLGYLLAGDVFSASVRKLAASLSLGLVWAYLFLQWIDLVAEYWALKRDPVPADLDVADRSAVASRLESLCGGSAVTTRVRHLVKSWSLGWHPRQVMGLAGFQSAQAKGQLYGGVVFALILLGVAVWLQGNSLWFWAAMLLLGLTVLARQTLQLRVDRYIECRLLACLPGNIPQTAMTAADLAGALGGAIQSAFKNHVPQPDAMAAAMRTAMDGAMQQVAGAIEKLQKSLGEGQGAVVEKWTQAVHGAASDLKGLQEALKAATGDLKSGLASASGDLKGSLATGAEQWKSVLQGHAQSLAAGTEQWKGVLQNHAQSLDKSLAAVPGQLAKTYGEGAGQVVAAFKDHAEKMAAASQGIQTQLDRIAQLGKEIEKVLHVQQAVDGTLKAVAATEEFRKTLDTLNKHVEASDKLLREAARPKTIRLVESDDDAKG